MVANSSADGDVLRDLENRFAHGSCQYCNPLASCHHEATKKSCWYTAHLHSAHTKGYPKQSNWTVGTASLDPSDPAKLQAAPEGKELIDTGAHGLDLYSDATDWRL